MANNIPVFQYQQLLNGIDEISRENVKELVFENNMGLWVFNISFSKVPGQIVNGVQQYIKPDASKCYDPLFRFLISQGFAKVTGGQTSTFVTKTSMSLRKAQKIKAHLKQHFENLLIVPPLPHIHIIISQPQIYE